MKYILFLMITIFSIQNAVAQNIYIDKTQPVLSHKQDRSAYINIIPDYLIPKPTASRTAGLYIYFFNEKKEKLLTPETEIESETDIYVDGWSPNDKYIVLDTGSDVERGKIVINSQTGEKIIIFAALEVYDWLNNDEIIFTNQVITNDPSIVDLRGHPPHEMSILNIKTLKRKVIKSVTQTEDFMFSKLENNKIIFYKWEYIKGKPFATKRSTWIMDIDGSNEKKLYDNKN